MALFDFETQAGITHVLASIRASKISPAQKNELRDIVFLYANGGHDQTVKLSLEQKLVAYAIEALPNTRNIKPMPKYTIGGTRQPPSDFAVVNTIKVPVQSAPQPATPVSASPPVVVTPPPYIPPAPIVPPPAPAPLPFVPPVQAAPAPQPLPVTPPPPVVPVQVIPPQPIPVAVAPATPPSTDFPSAGEQQLQRIREIKSLVNEQVGNPVNLIDIDNEAGREYMGALLDAMKKLNTGTSSVAAMQRLEQAYKNVDAAIKRHKSGAAQVNVKPMAQFVPTPTVQVIPPQPLPAPAPVAPLPYVPPVQVAPAPQPLPVTPPPPPAPRPVPQPMPPRPVVPPPAPPVRPVQVAPAPQLLPVTPPPPPRPVPSPLPPRPAQPSSIPPQPLPVFSPQPEESKNSWESSKPSTSAYADSKLTSLAESKLRAEPPVAPISPASSVTSDPLMSPEIDSGLDQLLSEWSLFKKSGLFGTGPKGREHPLFKKVSGLQIPLLLAGRFEGATQEIKQSITDYMNGWRYEQGIIYMPGETFERYLRRVIRHILDLQKKLPRT